MEWWQYVIGIIAFIIILGVIVLVHEGGHFLLARKAGILCHEFSIGMGPVLFQKKIGETVYSIRLIPIGGFVSMAGEEVNFDSLKDIKKIKLELDENRKVKTIITDVDNKKYGDLKLYEIVSYDIIGTKESLEDELYIEVRAVEETEESNSESQGTERYIVLRNAMMYMPKKQIAQIAPYDRNFTNKSIGQRFLAVFAGPATNFIFAFLLFVLLGFTQGYAKTNSTELGKIDDKTKENAPIYIVDSNISKNDEIISINGYNVQGAWSNITDIMSGFAKDKQYVVKNEAGVETTYEYKGYLEIVYKDESEDVTKSITVVPNTYLYSIQVVLSAYDEYGVKGYDEAGEYLKPYIGEFAKNNKKTLGYKGGLRGGDLITGVGIAENKKTKVEDIAFTDVKSTLELFDYFNKIETSERIVVRYERLNAETNQYEVKYSDQIESYAKEVLDASDVSQIKLEMGISPLYEFNFLKLLYRPFVDTAMGVVEIFRSLALLFNKEANVGLDDFSGPIGIFELITNASAEGLNALIYMTAFLSVNIGFVNLLPLPALDGGRLAFIVYEAITKKRPSPKVENIIHSVGFILLIGLFIFIGFNDILRLFKIK